MLAAAEAEILSPVLRLHSAGVYFSAFCKVVYIFFLFETGFLCAVPTPATHPVDQAGLELRDLAALPPKC